MSKKDQAIRHFKRILDGLEPKREIQRGMKGDGNGNIRVTNRPDYVYVRVKAAGSAIWEVIDHKVADIEDLPVLIERMTTGSDWQVIDVDIPMLADVGDGWSGEAYLPSHAKSHEWPDGDPGNDAVDVHPRALTPLRCYPKNDAELKVRVAPLRYTYGGQEQFFGGGELNLASYQPASGLARYVLTYLDPRDNAVYAIAGSTGFDSSVETLPNPSVPEYAVMSADVRLDGDQSAFTEDDMVDRRGFLDVISPDGLDAPFITTTYHSALSAERKLVAGSGITLTDQGPQQGLVITSTAGGAPSDAEYIVVSYNATLGSERVLAPGPGIKGTDAGADAEYVIELDIDELAESTAADDNDAIAIFDDTANAVRKQTRGNFLSGGAWVFNTVTVDLSSNYAEYSSLESAFSSEAAGTVFDLGPGTHALTSNGLPSTGTIRGRAHPETTKITGYTHGGADTGLPLDGAGHMFQIYAYGEDLAGGDAAGILIAATGCTARGCKFEANVSGGGVGYGVDLGGVTGDIEIYGGHIKATAAGGSTAYGLRVKSGLTAYLRDLPIIEGTDGALTGPGTVIGAYQDANGDIWVINGAPGTERRINSYLQASDGSPDPALSAGATGALTVASGLTITFADGGATVDEFSTDGTLAGNSDTALPTEKATKTYVDGLIGTAQDWTPTLNQGGGVAVTVNTAKYIINGSIVHAECKLTCTATGTAGNPIYVSGFAAFGPTNGTWWSHANGTVRDVGTANYIGPSVFGSTIAAYVVWWQPTNSYVGLNPSFALAVGDEIYWSATWIRI